MKNCPGCGEKYWFKGGAIRFLSEQHEDGFYDVEICKKCADILEKEEKKGSLPEENELENKA